MKYWIVGLGVLMAMAGCERSPTHISAARPNIAKATPHWAQVEIADKITDQSVKRSCVQSSGNVTSSDGTSAPATLCIWETKGKTLMQIRVGGSAQVVCREPGVAWCPVWLRYDAQKASQYPAFAGRDGSTKSLSFDPTLAKYLVDKLSRTSSLLTRVTIYSAGEQDLVFNVQNFGGARPDADPLKP